VGNLLLTEFRCIVDKKVDNDVASRGFKKNAHDCIDIRVSIYGFVVSRRRSANARFGWRNDVKVWLQL